MKTKTKMVALGLAGLMGANFVGGLNETPVVESQYEHGEFIVELDEGKSLSDVEAIQKYGITASKVFIEGDAASHEDLGQMYVFDPASVHDNNLESIMAEVLDDKDVDSVSKNYIATIELFSESSS